jgi:hypothetical protein
MSQKVEPELPSSASADGLNVAKARVRASSQNEAPQLHDAPRSSVKSTPGRLRSQTTGSASFNGIITPDFISPIRGMAR